MFSAPMDALVNLVKMRGKVFPVIVRRYMCASWSDEAPNRLFISGNGFGIDFAMSVSGRFEAHEYDLYGSSGARRLSAGQVDQARG